jgi:hypothetical protein
MESYVGFRRILILINLSMLTLVSCTNTTSIKEETFYCKFYIQERKFNINRYLHNNNSQKKYTINEILSKKSSTKIVYKKKINHIFYEKKIFNKNRTILMYSDNNHIIAIVINNGIDDTELYLIKNKKYLHSVCTLLKNNNFTLNKFSNITPINHFLNQ